MDYRKSGAIAHDEADAASYDEFFRERVHSAMADIRPPLSIIDARAKIDAAASL